MEEIDLGEGAVRQVVSGLAKFLTEEQFVVREGQLKWGFSGGQGGCAIVGKADLNLCGWTHVMSERNRRCDEIGISD